MRKSLKNAVLASLIGVTAASALPPEALAGPTAIAPASVVGLDNQTTAVHWRRWGRVRYGYWRPHRWGYYGYRRYGYYRPYYYRRAYYPYYGYRYDPSGAIFAGAALGLMGAGIAAASAPGWGWGWGPGWGYGGWGYGGWGGWGPGWGGWW